MNEILIDNKKYKQIVTIKIKTMKKFIIFFLMVFLYLGNSQARTETTLAEAAVGDVSSFALDGINATQASEYIIREFNCASGGVTLRVGNPQPGINYYWFNNGSLTATTVLHKGESCVVYTNNTFVLGTWPSNAPELVDATQLDAMAVTIYSAFTPKIVSTTDRKSVV